MTNANQFQVVGSGSVSQIDIAVGYVSGVNSFYVGIYANNNGIPGAQLGRWDNLTSSQNYKGCCGLVSITNVSGLNLIAGQPAD